MAGPKAMTKGRSAAGTGRMASCPPGTALTKAEIDALAGAGGGLMQLFAHG